MPGPAISWSVRNGYTADGYRVELRTSVLSGRTIAEITGKHGSTLRSLPDDDQARTEAAYVVDQLRAAQFSGRLL